MASGVSNGRKAAERVGLPPRPFLYTLDQISTILSLTEQVLTRGYIYFDGRESGRKGPNKMIARNIAPPDAVKPEWRVTETELVRWMRHKGFRFYDRGGAT